MFERHIGIAQPAITDTDTDQSAWASARIQKRLDTEMAAQLRMVLAPVFGQARSWFELRRGLRDKGFYLRASSGRLHLCDIHSHVKICTCRFLGFPSAGLETRLGRILPRFARMA